MEATAPSGNASGFAFMEQAAPEEALPEESQEEEGLVHTKEKQFDYHTSLVQQPTLSPMFFLTKSDVESVLEQAEKYKI